MTNLRIQCQAKLHKYSISLRIELAGCLAGVTRTFGDRGEARYVTTAQTSGSIESRERSAKIPLGALRIAFDENLLMRHARQARTPDDKTLTLRRHPILW
jgi:hypothetical protein